jgi:hypothetical protein
VIACVDVGEWGEQEQNKAVRVALVDLPGAGVTAERKPDEPLLVLRLRTPEEKANSGSSVIEGVGAYPTLLVCCVRVRACVRVMARHT